MRTFLFGSIFTALFILILTGGAPAPTVEKNISRTPPNISSTINALVPVITNPTSVSSSTITHSASLAASKQNPLVSPISKRIQLPLDSFNLTLSVPQEQFNDYLTGFSRCGFSKEVYENCAVTSTGQAYSIIIGSVVNGWRPMIEIFSVNTQSDEVAPLKSWYAGSVKMTLFTAPSFFKSKIASLYRVDPLWEKKNRHGILFTHPYSKQTLVIISDEEISTAELEHLVRGITFQR